MEKQWVLNGRRVQSPIKSIQRRQANVINTATLLDTLTSKVDPNNTVLELLGLYTVSGGQSGDAMVYIQLTDSQTVSLFRGTNTANQTFVDYQVTEYWPGVIKSVQRNTTTIAAGAVLTATTTLVQPVNLTRTSLRNLGSLMAGNYVGGSWTAFNVDLTLLDALTVQAQRGANSGFAQICGWEVIEWL